MKNNKPHTVYDKLSGPWLQFANIDSPYLNTGGTGASIITGANSEGTKAAENTFGPNADAQGPSMESGNGAAAGAATTGAGSGVA